MTNPTPPGQVPDALRLADECGYELAPGTRAEIAAELLRLHTENEALRAQQDDAYDHGKRTAHVQNPAEIEHVAGDVSKNGTESNTAQQPATSVTREFTNELGNAIRITVEGPNSTHENIVTPMEAEQLRSALNEHAQQPAPSAAAASKAVLAAIRAANMQLVRTGDDEFMLVPYKVATTQAAGSVPAISDLPPLPDIDLRDVGTKPQDVKDFLNGYATEYARLALAARAPIESVGRDAERLDFIERHPEMSLRHCKGKWALLGFTNYEYDLHLSLREAIDAAMAAHSIT